MTMPVHKLNTDDCKTPSRLSTYFKCLVDMDQATIRGQMPQLQVKEVCAFNQEQLQAAITTYGGWPNLLLAAPPATREHFFVITQHADHAIDFQEGTLKVWKMLPHLVLPSNVAYLHDRVCSNKKTPQRYGTQGRNIDGVWRPFVCESTSVDMIDSLRHAVRICCTDNFDDNRLQEYYRLMNHDRASLPALSFVDYNHDAITFAPTALTCK